MIPSHLTTYRSLPIRYALPALLVTCALFLSGRADAAPIVKIKRSGKSQVLTKGSQTVSAGYKRIQPLTNGLFLGFQKGRVSTWAEKTRSVDLLSPEGGHGSFYSLRLAKNSKAVLAKTDVFGWGQRVKAWGVVDSTTKELSSKDRFTSIHSTKAGLLIGRGRLYEYNRKWLPSKGEQLLNSRGDAISAPYKKIRQANDGSLTATKHDGTKVRLDPSGQELAHVLR